MSECPLQLRLQAYHDGELDRDPGARQSVEAHVAACPACAATLRELWDLSVRFGPVAVSPDLEPTRAELDRMYDAVDGEAARRDETSGVLRLGGMLAGLAASILIISAAWLVEGPTASSPAGGGNGPTMASAPDEDWQRVASAAEADPRPKVTQQSDSPYATHLADKQMSGWMIFNLDPTEH